MQTRPAEIDLELTLEGVDRIHGVTFDGSALWFAHDEGRDLKQIAIDDGRVLRTVLVPSDAGTAFDGHFLWVAGGDKIRKIDPDDGRVISEVPNLDATPVSGLAWADGALYAGLYRDQKILKINPETGEVLRTLSSDRLVTGITWTEGELWHATGGDDDDATVSELRRVDPVTGEVKERIAMPEGARVSGVEADGEGRLWCGDSKVGKLRAVRKRARGR